ncbi:hypothetical protein [Gordonia sp. i37]|uniref:hypothetical protein n=1 Tax=Gordonia sp. i37 TaxID=1961707 RepID=UPI0009AC768B|nr:hypothetical protein [Gordonia sp. i37]OPX14982.1 hypothetical protein B1964_12190 [Gordonia sp. i37]
MRTSSACFAPGFEKITHNIAELTRDAEDLDIHFAGGALMHPGAAKVADDYLGHPVSTSPNAQLNTRVGIARAAR